MVGLEDEAETRFSALSGGQQRRVDVAAGIIGRPDILFLDEPSTGLDPEARRHLWTGIANMTATGWVKSRVSAACSRIVAVSRRSASR